MLLKMLLHFLVLFYFIILFLPSPYATIQSNNLAYIDTFSPLLWVFDINFVLYFIYYYYYYYYFFLQRCILIEATIMTLLLLVSIICVLFCHFLNFTHYKEKILWDCKGRQIKISFFLDAYVMMFFASLLLYMWDMFFSI